MLSLDVYKASAVSLCRSWFVFRRYRDKPLPPPREEKPVVNLVLTLKVSVVHVSSMENTV